MTNTSEKNRKFFLQQFRLDVVVVVVIIVVAAAAAVVVAARLAAHAMKWVTVIAI